MRYKELKDIKEDYACENDSQAINIVIMDLSRFMEAGAVLELIVEAREKGIEFCECGLAKAPKDKDKCYLCENLGKVRVFYE